jgi:PAS domain S-box-containing protein
MAGVETTQEPTGQIPDPAELIETLPVAVVCTDDDEHYTLRFANSQAAELLGYDRDEFLHGRKYAAATVVHPDDLPVLERADHAHRRGIDRIVLRYRLIASDGSVIPVLDVGTRRLDASGRLVGFTSVLIDLRELPALQGPPAILTNLP